ncbi:Uncharacterized membrane protein [Hathewaya proteolytica DSM 3090]|uniref:Uncharacterized membrane protein n=1 Tax=Hathewaya proteolytica DSM 3090 TaxID=1121331 RepID=A0A1M6PIN7_9CLOT|nr:putative ABC transporter permease [Hathewaya proteolytica]SHK07787.1 Uncharacterized membrane protein [Hathewaya proteolytica DSM 3090]
MNASLELFFTLLFYFVIYAHIGWIMEVCYAYKNQRKFVNRGFLYGPYCSMYGFAAIVLIYSLKPFQHNIIILYIASFFITSIVEYITGALLEKMFHTTWWDYSEDKFNIKGRICLGFSLLWGAVAVLLIKFVNPLISRLLKYVLTTPGIIILLIILILIIIDTICTLISVSNFNKSMDKIKENFIQLKQKLKLPNVKFPNMKLSHKNKIEQEMLEEFTKNSNKTFEALQKNYDRFIKVFPDLTVHKFKSFVNKLKDMFK